MAHSIEAYKWTVLRVLTLFHMDIGYVWLLQCFDAVS